MAARDMLNCSRRRGPPALLAVAMVAFCLWSAAPTAAADTGCGSLQASARVCGQPGSPDPLPEVAVGVTPLWWSQAPVAWVSVTAPPCSLARFDAGPHTPRAPPSSLL